MPKMTALPSHWTSLHLFKIPMTNSLPPFPKLLASDPVHNPEHYTAGTIECIDAIKAALTPDEFRGYCKGNAIKYIWRERLKGQDESILKAIWYLNRETHTHAT
jgi:hypothetical protein